MNLRGLFEGRHLVVLFCLLVACGGGSCSGCEACGLGPIPGSFPQELRFENAAQARLTDVGIARLEANAPSLVPLLLGGALEFPVPATSGTFDGVPLVGSVDYTLCPDGGCAARGEITSVDLAEAPPNAFDLTSRVVVDTRDASGSRASIPIHLVGGCIFGFCTVDTTCQADVDTTRGARREVALSANVAINEEKHAAREGYSRIDVSRAALVPGENLETEDVDFSGCDGLVGGLINLVSGLITGTIVSSLETQVTSLVESSVTEQLCMKDTTGCPLGTFSVAGDAGGVCRFEDHPEAACVPTLIGVEGRGDLGATLLSQLAPGAHGPMELLIAAGGDGEVVNGGLSLFMLGGIRSFDPSFARSPGHDACVPLVDPPALPNIPRAEAMRENTIPGTTQTADLGIGLTEPYLDQVGYAAFDSGMLCLAVGTRTSPQLATGLVSVLARSLRDLTFPAADAPMSIALRPQAPPTFSVDGGDQPLLTASLPRLEMDLYAFAHERYTRVLTFRADVAIRLDLEAEGGELVTQIRSVDVTNASVTRSDLMTESEDSLATVLTTVVETFVSMLSSKIPPFALPAVMGFGLDVPEGGLVAIHDRTGVDLIGLYGNLILPTTPSPIVREVDTTLELRSVDFDPRTLTLDEFGAHGLPRAIFVADGEGPGQLEWSHRLDGGAWSAWSNDRTIEIESRGLLLQGRHAVEVRARAASDPGSFDRTPAHAEVVIDGLAPDVALVPDGAGLRLDVSDLVSPYEKLEVRTRDAAGTWSAWRKLERTLDAATRAVEVRDESGNVGSAQAALIRGLPDPHAMSACGCDVPGNGSLGRGWLVALFVLALLVVRSRVRRRSSFALFALLAGCSAPGGSTPPVGHRDLEAMCASACVPAAPPATSGTMCCPSTNACVPYELASLCEPGFQCDPASVTLDDACTVTCESCSPRPALEPGLLATHLDLALAASGRAIVSGYSAGAPPSSRYGDLVVGREQADGTIDFEIVDGVPNAAPSNDPSGYRDGIGEPGDDVGEWSSIAALGERIYVSYYDRTHGALKIATYDGLAWTVRTLDDSGDAGRHTDLVLDREGRPAIAYARIARALPSGPSKLESTLLVARAHDEAATDFDFVEVASAEMACRPSYCDEGESCFATGECRTPSSDCSETCAEGSACVAGACAATLPTTFLDDHLPALGLFPSLATTDTDLGVAFYDRSTGTLFGARVEGTMAGAPFAIDGYGANSGGDSGLSASLAVDPSGVWHVAYVDGTREELRYARIQGTTIAITRVDDGTANGAPHADGRHVVGDDASIVVTPSGDVRIAYQDASDNVTLLATLGEGGFTTRTLDSEAPTGFFVAQTLSATYESVIASFHRNAVTRESGVRVLRTP